MRTKLGHYLTFIFVLVMQIGLAQEQKEITGTVTDEDGNPLPGVNITIEETATGTSTDFDGNYALETEIGHTLIFEYIGFSDHSEVVGDENEINVSLQEGSMLGEVIITGAMGIQRSADAVSSSQKLISSEDLTRGNNPSAIEALNGKVSGLVITNTSSGVGENNSIQLRGSRSITGNNEALIVIDNVISDESTFASLPPD